MVKKSIFFVMCIMLVFANNFTAMAKEDMVGAEVTVEAEDKFTSYRTPEEDEIAYDPQEVDVEEEKKLGANDTFIDNAKDDESTENIQEDKDLELKQLDAVPQTGDSTNLVIWGGILIVTLVATIALGVIVFKRK